MLQLSSTAMSLDGTPRLVLGMAERLKRAFSAFGLTRNAELPPMVDDLVREADPAVSRQHLHQVLLDVAGVVGFREFEPA